MDSVPTSARRDRYLWYLYDFANSIALVTVLYYFSLWVVVDEGLSQWVVSLPVSFSTLALIIFMPRIARRVDRSGSHKRVMVAFSALAAIALLVISFLKPGEYLPYVVFAVYFLFYFCYQSGYIFFTSFLHELAEGSDRVRVSGFGQLWGQIGNLAGVLISFATVGLALFGVVGKQQAFLWAALIFIVLLVPILWFRAAAPRVERRTETGEFNLSTFKKVYRNKRIFWFLITYIFYADSMMTISFFVTLYLTKGVGLTPEIIRFAGVSMLLGTIVGGLLTARLHRRDQLDSIKKLLFAWPILLFAVAALSSPVPIIALVFAVGIVFSMIFAVCRSYYSSLIPYEERAEYFSLYVIFERMGAVVGPIIWSSVIAAFAFLGDSGAYRMAMVSTAVITLGSLLVLRRVEKTVRA